MVCHCFVKNLLVENNDHWSTESRRSEFSTSLTTLFYNITFNTRASGTLSKTNVIFDGFSDRTKNMVTPTLSVFCLDLNEDVESRNVTSERSVSNHLTLGHLPL